MSHNVSPSKTWFQKKFIVKTVYTHSLTINATSAIADVTHSVYIALTEKGNLIKF